MKTRPAPGGRPGKRPGEHPGDPAGPRSAAAPADPPRPSGKASELLGHGPVAPGSSLPARDRDLALPHERDESTGLASTAQAGSGAAGQRQREVMKQAADDLAQGQVDTDLHATPGLDAQRRRALLEANRRPSPAEPAGRSRRR